MVVYHGSHKKIENINYDMCHLGWHAGNLCQAIDIANPGRLDDKFDWENTYVYVCDINPTNDNTICIPDMFLYEPTFIKIITRRLATECINKFPNNHTLYSSLLSCTSDTEIRDVLLSHGIKYIKYENKYESPGYSYCILDIDTDITEFSLYNLIINHIDFNNDGRSDKKN